MLINGYKKAMKQIDHKIRLNYYTLFIDWENDGNFSPEFGDWNKSTVTQELRDEYAGESFKIEVTLESLPIETGIEILNTGCI